MYNSEVLFGRLESRLSVEQMAVVRRCLKCDEREPDLLVLKDEHRREFMNAGFLDQFEKVCRELSIRWRYSADHAW